LDPERVGALLRELRLARNLTPTGAASRSGLTRPYIGLVERGMRKPTVEAVSRLLTAYNMSWRDFGERLDHLSEVKGSGDGTR
jgi:transcriptional regulator with XRE-family HTH domain